MNFLAILLQDSESWQKWYECAKQTPFPGGCPPPGAEMTRIPITLSLLLCAVIGSLTIFAFVFHAISREQAISREEFQEASARIVYRVAYLTLRKGEDLRWLCWVLSRDLIRITQYIMKEVHGCFYETGASLENKERVMVMLDLLRVSRAINGDARLVKVRIRLHLPVPYEILTETTERYMSMLLALLERYRLKNPECADRFPV
jgi:hypothetical protein